MEEREKGEAGRTVNIQSPEKTGTEGEKREERKSDSPQATLYPENENPQTIPLPKLQRMIEKHCPALSRAALGRLTMANLKTKNIGDMLRYRYNEP